MMEMTKEEFKKIILPIALLDEGHRALLTKALEGNFDNYMKAKLKNHSDLSNDSDLFNESVRDKFFNECVSSRVVKSKEGIVIDCHRWISYTPHDLFEWFKHNCS